ncbi:MAG TPA: dienelactone hydrolase family protein [Rhodocyclaceae bacterium]|nr:dienelactone hydrolase family protein [Rhodocyclaceae bacterium]
MHGYLPAIELETAVNPTFSIIWLHGLGADGNDFVSIVPELDLPASPGVRFIFPHAPVIPVTCNNGYAMRAWYDIYSMSGINRQVDEKGIRASREAVRRLITRENERGVPTDRIMLAGFSQGGAIAYSTGLTHPDTLAGIIALSTYLPSPSLVADEWNAANRNTPIFAAHGIEDGVVPLQLGIHARNTIQQHNPSLAWHTYHMPHSVCMEEIDAIGTWMRAIMSKT